MNGAQARRIAAELARKNHDFYYVVVESPGHDEFKIASDHDLHHHAGGRIVASFGPNGRPIKPGGWRHAN